jgi:hypothetical protein
MMIIVPTFTLSKNCRPPKIAGIIFYFEGTIVSHMSHRVDHPSCMPEQRGSNKYTRQERQELNRLRRDVKRLAMEREFLTAVASSGGTPPTLCLKKAAAFCCARTAFYAGENSPMN